VEAVEAELKKGMCGNAKLSHWVGFLQGFYYHLSCCLHHILDLYTF